MLINDAQNLCLRIENLLLVENGKVVFPNNSIISEIQSIKTEIQEVLNNKQAFFRELPVFFMKKWSRGSLNRALDKLSQAEKATNFEDFKKNIKLAFLWTHQASSIIATRNVLKNKLFSNSGLIVDIKKIERGSIILSYKTSKFLRKDPFAKLIAIATNSSITHAYVATLSHNKDVKLLCSSASGKGVNLINPIPKLGEIFIVMKLSDRLVEKNKLIYKEIDKLSHIATANKYINEYKFAEIKSWVASLIGFIWVISCILFEKPITLKNPIKMKKKVFCSEVVDIIFKNAGIIVTPRSEHDAVVGPVEFFHSPYLVFDGIIMNSKEDKNSLEKELIESFNLNAEVLDGNLVNVNS